jgi:glycopeptide antibiotics resistance protein
MFLRHPILSLITLLYLAIVGWITLGPQPFDSTNGLIVRVLELLQRHEATDWVTYAGIEFTANVFMFLPIGLFFLLLFGRGRWWLAILVGVVLTFAIETAQLVIPGRVSDARDLAANSAGAVLGVLVALVLTAAKARNIRLAALRGARARARGAE